MIGPKKLLQSIQLRNFLSFGDSEERVSFESLNVLIGPNASGKSNLIEALSLLHATPRDLLAPIREGGGVGEWLWKGAKAPPIAEINALVTPGRGTMPLKYHLKFTSVYERFEMIDEVVENAYPYENRQDVYFYYRFQNGQPVINVQNPAEEAGPDAQPNRRGLRREDIEFDQSVLSQRKDPDQFPVLTYLGNQFGKFRFYREWNLGRYTAPRLPQKADLPEDFLLEDGSNLGLVLNDLMHRSDTEQSILSRLKRYNDAFVDIKTKIHGGSVQIFLHEKGLQEPVPATRLSDGTLRYICLLAILCHPSPPPLICLEEPELGLHPDVIPVVAELLIEASQKTQLFVTTHSDSLVSALSDCPESVLVCEKDAEGTHLRRLDRKQLSAWLEKYSLGELWRMGEIGGTAG